MSDIPPSKLKQLGFLYPELEDSLSKFFKSSFKIMDYKIFKTRRIKNSVDTSRIIPETK